MFPVNPKLVEASQLLTKKKVGNNLSYLLNHSPLTADDVKVLTNPLIPEAFQYQKIDIALELQFAGDSYVIVVDGLRVSDSPDPEEILTKHGNFTLNVNSLNVLKTEVAEVVKSWGSRFSVSVSDYSIKALKAGDWIDGLSLLTSKLEACRVSHNDRSFQKILEQRAAQVDLGEYKS